MVKERRRRSQELGARDVERKCLTRRVVANATGPDAVERRRIIREQNTVRQCVRCSCLAVERAACSRVSPSSQPFLPMSPLSGAMRHSCPQCKQLSIRVTTLPFSLPWFDTVAGNFIAP